MTMEPRFLFLLAIVAAPLLARTLDFIPAYEAEIDKPVLNVVFMVLLIAGILWFYPVPSAGALDARVAAEYPAQALSYFREHPPDGLMLNWYLWGGYLGWKDRSLKVFVDSRVDVFEFAGVFKDYIDLIQAKEPDKVLEKHHIRYVLFSPAEHLSALLERDPQWRVTYRHWVCVLFEKVDEHREISQ